MPTPLDLRAFSAALPEQDLSPRSLKATVCGSITAAVGAFAEASPNARYTIDPVVLKRVVGDYLETHPTHNNPFNLMVTELDDTCRVDYYEMCYGTNDTREGKFEFIPELRRRELVDGIESSCGGIDIKEGKWQYVEQLKGMDLVDGKHTYCDILVMEGKWQYVEQLKKMCLVNGKTTLPDGRVLAGERQYIEQLKEVCLVNGKKITSKGDIYSGTFKFIPGMTTGTQLVNGTITYTTGRSETGEFAYIPQLNSMKLVNGTTRNAEGEVVKQGRREYVPQKNGMVLIEGLSIFPDGTRQEGTREYIPELNEVVLTAGSITRGNNVQTGTWVYSRYEGRMVFAPTPPKTKLPLYVRNQIQGVVQELVGIQHQFDSTGKYNTSAAMLNTAAEQATLAQNPEQYHAALQSFGAQYKTLTRELCLLTHPDKVGNYSASVHGVTFQQLGDLREAIDAKVSRWRLATVDWR